MKNKIRMGFATAFTVFTLSIMPVQAGTAAKGSTTASFDPRGFASISTVQASKSITANKKPNIISTTADSESASTTSASTTATRICDFSGFADGDSVNRAYAGGTSSRGITKVNNQIAFNGAVAINSYNGSGEPNPGTVYSPSNGFIIVSLDNFSASEIYFYYASYDTLTISTFSSTDGSGTPISINYASPNFTGSYNVWTKFISALTSNVHSIKILGVSNQFGIDQLVVTAVNPSPTIVSVSPTYGSQFGGTAFTLTGTNFTGATSVTIGGVAATNLVVVSATQITADTPFSSTSGAKDVVVTTPAGSSTAVASFTYTAAVPVLALTNNAGSCNRVGATIDVDATLSGVVSPIVAGQINITWDSSKMTLDSITAGDAPFIEFHIINQTAGTALILVSLEQGGSAVSVSSKVVARLHYTVAGGSCDGSGTDIQFFPDGTLPTEFTDGVGGTMVPALVASSGFTVDDGAPVLSNVPPSVTVQAEAGMGSYANVALTPPTATDACSPLTQTAVRSDGASFGAAFPVGTTTVTWSATDPCANTTTDTTLVTVNNANTATFAVSYSGGYPASSSRNFALDIHGDNGNNARSTSAMFAAGTTSFSITDLAIATYDCVSIRDIGHSLRRRVAMSDVGTDWSATATLIAGDLNGNDVIDVVDWGMYIVGNSNADLDGNGVINSYDGAIIITNFGKQSDAVCGGALMGPPDPISAISVAELVDRGLTDLIGADLNNDGWLDMEDVRIAN